MLIPAAWGNWLRISVLKLCHCPELKLATWNCLDPTDNENLNLKISAQFVNQASDVPFVSLQILTCYFIGVVSVTSASHFLTLASRYQTRLDVFQRIGPGSSNCDNLNSFHNFHNRIASR